MLNFGFFVVFNSDFFLCFVDIFWFFFLVVAFFFWGFDFELVLLSPISYTLYGFPFEGNAILFSSFCFFLFFFLIHGMRVKWLPIKDKWHFWSDNAFFIPMKFFLEIH